MKIGHDALRNHPFFANIDWDLLEAKRMPPPYIPLNEKLEILSDDQCEPKPLCELLREADKANWCEEFEPPPSNDVSDAIINIIGSSHLYSHMRIRATDQYYFRLWNYINPNIIKSNKMQTK